MDKKMFLAVLLSIGVIFGYYTLFPPPPPKESAKDSATAPLGPPPPQASGSGAGPQTIAPQAGQPATGSIPRAPAPRVSQPPRKEVAAKQVVIDTPRYIARVDTRGGRLVSFKLKHYYASKTFINWVDIIPFLGAYLSKAPADSGEFMEMIKNELREVDALDVSFVGEQRRSLEFRNVLFEPDRGKIVIKAEAGAPRRLVLTGSGKDGLTISKILTFHPDSYIVDYEVRVINYGEAPRQLRVMHYLGEGPDTGSAEQNIRSFYGPVFREDGSVDTEDADDIEEALIVRSPQWLGITANYFITAVAPESKIDHAEFRSIKLITEEGEEKWSAYYGIELPAVRLEPGNMIAGRMQLYMGPKNTGELKKFGNGLEESIRQTFEWLGPLARGLLAILHWFHGFTGNYGVSIIMLTVLVRVVMFPLTYKGMVSMRRMSKLQPKMKALREKFGDNKERLNKETMAMYKRYKINPLGGCLPILVQMPIFFALYSALLTAIELRHAPFIWWIQDLSAMDHLFITPLLMGASMFIQQRLTPSSMDPAQQRILMFMPLIFMIFMFSFPSGLVLYWVTSNSLSILQQVIINRARIPDLVESSS